MKFLNTLCRRCYHFNLAKKQIAQTHLCTYVSPKHDLKKRWAALMGARGRGDWRVRCGEVWLLFFIVGVCCFSHIYISVSFGTFLDVWLLSIIGIGPWRISTNLIRENQRRDDQDETIACFQMKTYTFYVFFGVITYLYLFCCVAPGDLQDGWA